MAINIEDADDNWLSADFDRTRFGDRVKRLRQQDKELEDQLETLEQDSEDKPQPDSNHAD